MIRAGNYVTLAMRMTLPRLMKEMGLEARMMKPTLTLPVKCVYRLKWQKHITIGRLCTV